MSGPRPRHVTPTTTAPCPVSTTTVKKKSDENDNAHPVKITQFFFTAVILTPLKAHPRQGHARERERSVIDLDPRDGGSLAWPNRALDVVCMRGSLIADAFSDGYSLHGGPRRCRRSTTRPRLPDSRPATASSYWEGPIHTQALKYRGKDQKKKTRRKRLSRQTGAWLFCSCTGFAAKVAVLALARGLSISRAATTDRAWMDAESLSCAEPRGTPQARVG